VLDFDADAHLRTAAAVAGRVYLSLRRIRILVDLGGASVELIVVRLPAAPDGSAMGMATLRSAGARGGRPPWAAHLGHGGQYAVSGPVRPLSSGGTVCGCCCGGAASRGPAVVRPANVSVRLAGAPVVATYSASMMRSSTSPV
jgi:hypothetical protein